MKTRKLSDRALIVLQHIADRSQDGRKWLPGHARGCDDHDEPTGVYLNIGGSGDAAILRSLVAAELLERSPPKHDCTNQYNWLQATVDGRMLLAKEANRIETIRLKLVVEKRKYEHANTKGSGNYEETELRELYPEFYQ